MTRKRKTQHERTIMSDMSSPHDNIESDGRVLIDYQGYTGHDHAYDHDGPWMDADGGTFLVLWPGLNVVDAELWAACKDRESVRLRLDDGRLAEVDPSFTRYQSPAAMTDLVSRTQLADSLELLQAYQATKPQAGPQRGRRDPNIVGLIERRLAIALRRKVPNLGDLGPALHQRVEVMTAAHA